MSYTFTFILDLIRLKIEIILKIIEFFEIFCIKFIYFIVDTSTLIQHQIYAIAGLSLHVAAVESTNDCASGRMKQKRKTG